MVAMVDESGSRWCCRALLALLYGNVCMRRFAADFLVLENAQRVGHCRTPKKVEKSSCKAERISVIYIPALSVTGQVAQLVEQGIENPRAGGSSPSLTTIEL